MSSTRAFKQLVLANIRSYLRQPEAIFWTYAFPLIMVIGLGFAFNSDTEVQTLFTVTEAASGNPVIAQLMDDDRFVVEVRSEDDALERLRRNRTPLVVTVDAAGRFDYHFDPTNPDGATARALVDDAAQRASGRQDTIAANDVHTDAPGSRYVDFLVPGLIGMNLMGAGLWGIGFNTVDLRVRNLLKRLVATPMRRGHFLLALVASRVLFFIPEMTVLLLVANLLFGVPIAGSYVAVVLTAFLGSITFAGIGLLAASRAKTIESISGLMNLIMIPMWLGSGIFFSSERFPAAVQPLIQALPLTQLINALRAIILVGEPLVAQWPALGILAAWCVGSYLLALKIFRWV
jgi:ABC-type multidrug transport system permease subunit